LRDGKPKSIEEEAKKLEETSVFSPAPVVADAGHSGEKLASAKTTTTSEGA
jgi:hypothetical protein